MFPGTVDKKKNPANYQFNTDSTYSVSFHSNNFDLCQWKIVNLPGGREMELQGFWGNLPTRLLAYQIVPPEGFTGNYLSIPHAQKYKKYMFCYEVSKVDGEVVWKKVM